MKSLARVYIAPFNTAKYSEAFRKRIIEPDLTLSLVRQMTKGLFQKTLKEEREVWRDLEKSISQSPYN